MLWTKSNEYGELIPDLMINGKPASYPVVNDRAVRAGAGLMLMVGVVSFVYVALYQNYWWLYAIVPVFFFEFLFRVVKGPSYGIFSILGEILVHNQQPEWVGAIQKRFAWSIGIFMASLMIIFALLLQVRGWIPLTICGTCLFFMWLESCCGICVGCKMYSFLLNRGILPEPDVRPACPGGVCEIDEHTKKSLKK